MYQVTEAYFYIESILKFLFTKCFFCISCVYMFFENINFEGYN